MKYTDEQKAILSICRKYSKVVCKFHGEDIEIYIDPNWDREEWFNGYGKQTKVAIEDWLKNHATPKQVGRPKGSIKPSRKVKRDISLSVDQWSKVEKIRRQQGLKYTSHAIGLVVEAFSKSRTAIELQSMIGNDCCICKHVEYCPNATWETDKLNTCSKWQLATSTFGFDGLKIGGE